MAETENRRPNQDPGGRVQTVRIQSTPGYSRTASSQETPRAACTSPEAVFAVANALSVLFASQLTQEQLQTLINLLTFLVSGLSTIVTQQQICEGIIVQQAE